MTAIDARRLLLVALLACSPAGRDRVDTTSLTMDTARDSAAAADTAPPRWVVRADGIGPLRMGVPLAAASRTLGETLRVTQAGCDHVNPTTMPEGIRLMVIDDTIARVEIDSAGIHTAEGAQVGDSESRVLELYGARARIEPHKYTYPDGHYVVVTPPGDTLHRIIFETLKGRVTTYRAGRVPAVQLVEGCS
ncbi:MAG TPA: hypothetical protein VJ802_13455 [Gemmatimonadaceae bacterium]|nr:hypothetical protein [Gemmatimonadaceae bacterium]